MPTSYTRLTLMNRALDIVGEFPMSTLADSNAYARWLNRNFTPAVEAALRQQPWNFACELHELNALPHANNYRWRRKFALPNGWLRVLPMTHNGYRNGRPVPHEVKGNHLFTNASAPARVECVMNVQEPGAWDSLFAEMIAGRLAVGMAHRFTAKASFVAAAKQVADEAFAAAEEANAFEGSLEPVEDLDIIRVRGYHGGW